MKLFAFLLLVIFLIFFFFLWFEIFLFRLLKIWLHSRGDRCLRELFLLRSWAIYRIASIDFFNFYLFFFEIKLLCCSKVVIDVVDIKVIGIGRKLSIAEGCRKWIIEGVHRYFFVLYCHWFHHTIKPVLFKTNFKTCSNSHSRSISLT